MILAIYPQKLFRHKMFPVLYGFFTPVNIYNFSVLEGRSTPGFTRFQCD